MQYIIDNEMMYEVILSKGKGKPTKKLTKMLVMLANRVASKKKYYSQEDRNDCINHSIMKLFDNWEKFDEKRYSKAINYYTEVAKRGLADGFNVLNNMKEYNKRPIKYVRITNKMETYI